MEVKMKGIGGRIRNIGKGTQEWVQRLKYREKVAVICFLTGLFPLTVMGIFCYHQTSRLLYKQEYRAMDSAIQTAVEATDTQIRVYEGLLSYLASTDVVFDIPFQDTSRLVDTYERLNYEFDVFLNSLNVLHPEVLQITVYNAQSDLTHGKQLRPLSDLEAESWYTPEAVTAKPSWYLNDDGTLRVIQRLPNPYEKYVRSYSENCISITLDPENFFRVLTSVSDDCRLRVISPRQTLYSFLADTLDGGRREQGKWYSLNRATTLANWLIVLEKPSRILTEPISRMSAVIVLIILTCLLLIVVMSGFWARLFMKRINLFYGHIQEVKNGNLELDVRDDCPDEIGELTNSFQEMLDRLNRLIQEDYQNKIHLREAELKALQAQINPHFLYNCLSLINSRALLAGQPEISRMSQLLSVFYRTTLNKGKSETTLESELKNVSSYLDIQKLLHEDLFEVTWQVEPDLPEVKIPNLLLQPLVENALVHGILPNKPKKGRLFLSVSRVMNQIRFTILDNGVGIPREKLPTLLQTDSGGYGLKNVDERLRLTYGEEYGLNIQSIEGESTMVTFCIPFHGEEEGEKE